LKGACEAQESRAATFFSTVSDYWALTKPEANFLILITTFAGFYVASTSGPVNFYPLLAFYTLPGTLLVAGGTATLTGKCDLLGDKILSVASTAGTRKIIVTATHIKAAAHSWSSSAERPNTLGAEI
jgi:heme O synthase-like polyprenyltransferase